MRLKILSLQAFIDCLFLLSFVSLWLFVAFTFSSVAGNICGLCSEELTSCSSSASRVTLALLELLDPPVLAVPA